MKCSKCGYEWEARIPNPKECPRCKQRLDYFMAERALEKRKGGVKVKVTPRTWGGIAALIVVASIAAWALLPAPMAPMAIDRPAGSWDRATIRTWGDPVVLAAPEPAFSGLENVYIVDNAHAAGFAINFSGNENVMGVITGSGAAATIPYGRRFRIVVAAKGHRDNMAHLVRENMMVHLRIAAWGIHENRTGTALHIFHPAPPTHVRVNAVWDNAGHGYVLPAGGSVFLDNIALLLWR